MHHKAGTRCVLPARTSSDTCSVKPLFDRECKTMRRSLCSMLLDKSTADTHGARVAQRNYTRLLRSMQATVTTAHAFKL
jgi:hypothetical protein